MLKKSFLYFALFSALCQHVLGQSIAPITPDRPGLGESALLVRTHFFQIESGVNIEWDKEASTSQISYTLNSTTLRYGLSDFFELRLAFSLQQDYFSSGLVESKSILELNPWLLGFKARITEHKGVVPRMAFLGNLAFPYAAAKSFKTTYPAPAFLIPMEWDLSEFFLLTTNVGASWNGSSPAPAYFTSLGLDIVLPFYTGFFIESYANIDEKGSFLPGLNGGLLWRITPDLQIDVSAGIGLNSKSADGFLNGGISYRIFTKRENTVRVSKLD